VNTAADILAVKNVSIGYGKMPVVRDINLEVHPGEFFGLIGLNGAGKTTLIKAMLGLRHQDAGEISVFGHEAGSRGAKAGLAYLPERFDPPWFLTGIEFLRFSLRLYKQKFDEAAVIAAAEKLVLDPVALKRRVQTYSKGMRQKLGLLGTVLTNCPLLVLDEPMSGLDPKARTLVKDMLVKGKAPGQTIFFCSHILADMDEICDRVAILHEGTLCFTGKPADLKAKTGSENLERAFLHFVEERAVL
jgi:ABC-2 type transport system ATP-binding protein